MLAKADMDDVRTCSLNQIQTYKVIKSLIWSCAVIFDKCGNEIASNVQLVDMKLIMGLMDETKLLLDLHKA